MPLKINVWIRKMDGVVASRIHHEPVLSVDKALLIPDSILVTGLPRPTGDALIIVGLSRWQCKVEKVIERLCRGLGRTLVLVGSRGVGHGSRG